MPARTVTYDAAVGGDPLTTSVTDPVGTITTKVDLLGRVVAYTDVWGTGTTTGYDQAGRAIASTTTGSGTTSTLTWTYDFAGRPLTTVRDGLMLAVTAYDAAGEVVSVSYPSGSGSAGNGTALAGIAKNGAGALTGLEWAFPGGQNSVAEAVVRSQAGKVLSSTISDGGTSAASSYTYDAAGRLVTAAIPRHQLTYDYTSATGCAGVPGAVTLAGKNSNRMGTTDSLDGGPASATAYCYDAADRLIATTTTGASIDANSVNGTDLTMTGGATATISYDDRGNTTRLADQTLFYDGADRHSSTTLADGTAVTYARDATDRIVSRTHKAADGEVLTARYSYTGEGDAPNITLAGDDTVTERVLALPGGVVITDTGTADTWAYPNVHGDVLVLADGAGSRQSAQTYDPFGQPLDTGSGSIGTHAADDAGPDTSAGDMDSGWLGQFQRGYEHAATIAALEMGARSYLPALGRFVEVDPVEGGSANSYDYGNADSINQFDIDGRTPRRPVFTTDRCNRIGNNPNGWAYYGCVPISRPEPRLSRAQQLCHVANVVTWLIPASAAGRMWLNGIKILSRVVTRRGVTVTAVVGGFTTFC